jgi:4-hydroxythreonine-4-phosphate dehydrogenase
MKNDKKPRIALVLGDPCGIGPELAAKLLADPATTEKADIVAVADQSVFDEAQKIARVSVDYQLVDQVSEKTLAPGGITLLSRPTVGPDGHQRGRVSKSSGTFQLDCLAAGLKLCQSGLTEAMCFAPLNKEAMHLAGLSHEDESGFFIDQLSHQGDFGLLNTLGNLWTSRATSHVSHRQVSEMLSQEAILQATRLLDSAVRASGINSPRIAVAGLNPHAGDGGNFGSEEIEIIEPAVQLARQEGINAEGPFPPDTIFLMGRDGKYDAIVTMYHDQGQIAMKLMGFERGVTVHAGLPFPVTTSAHGSAFDIAGQGIANESALRQAFLLACSMAGENGEL